MKKLIPVLAAFCSVFTFSQSKITVISAGDHAPISNATVSCNKKFLGKTSADGVLSFVTRCKKVEVSAQGFYPDDAVTDRVMELVLTNVDPKVKNIDAINLRNQSDPEALDILQKVDANYNKNSPRSLDSYSYKSYEKYSYDFDEDSLKIINGFVNHRLDSLRHTPPTVAAEKVHDSLAKIDVMKLMRNSKLFLWERAQEHFYNHTSGEHVKVLDNRVSGLQQPLYELMTLRSNRDKIPAEIREENRKLYHYFLTDTIDIDGRKNYVIRFREADYVQPIQHRRYNGYIYVDAETYALKKLESNGRVKSDGTATIIWRPIDGKWFLYREDIKMKRGNAVFGEGLPVRLRVRKNINNLSEGSKKFGNYIYISADYFDFKIPSEGTPKDFRGYTTTVDRTDGRELWKYRTDSLNVREKNTYVKIDSIGKKYGVDRKAQFVAAILKGNLRSGMVDFDISKVFDYNVYEGLRLGLGAKLNENFNRYISPDAYFAYGFRDRGWKFGAGVDVRTTLKKNSVFRAEFYKDVAASGGFSENLWNFRMHIMNSGVEVNNDKFYKYTGGKISYTNDLTNGLTMVVSAKRDHEEAGFPYDFRGLGNAFDNTAAMLTLKFSPNSKNIMTPGGKYTYSQGYPEAYLNVEQGMKSLGGDLKYTRVDLLFLHNFRTALGTTGVRLFGGLTSPDAPIWHQYTMNGLASDRTGLNYTLSSYLGFATMRSGKYFNDKFVGYYFTHRIPWYFKSFGKNTSNFDVVYRGTIGNMSHPEYQNMQFEKLDHLYQEVGLEWNNFLSSQINLGAFYRVGYYATPGFKENFALQIKLKALGF